MGQCQACGNVGETSGHHVIYEPEFVVQLCPKCHSRAEQVVNGRTRTIVVRHKIGKELLMRFQMVKYGEKGDFLNRVTQEKGLKKSEIYAYMQFAKKIPEVYQFLAKHPNISWGDIVHTYLPKEK